MAFESSHYFEINTGYLSQNSLIWINVDIKWILLEQNELKEFKICFDKLAKSLVACFVVVVFSGNRKFKLIPYMQHQLISVCTNI